MPGEGIGMARIATSDSTALGLDGV